MEDIRPGDAFTGQTSTELFMKVFSPRSRLLNFVSLVTGATGLLSPSTLVYKEDVKIVDGDTPTER